MQFSKWCQDLIYFQETIFGKKFFSYIIYLSSSLEYLKIGKFVAPTNYFLHGPQSGCWFLDEIEKILIFWRRERQRTPLPGAWD